jgi:hypothetical protein
MMQDAERMRIENGLVLDSVSVVQNQIAVKK